MRKAENRHHLMVALHGYAGSAADMAHILVTGIPSDADVTVVAPDGPHRPELGGVGRAWFPITSVRSAIGIRAARVAPAVVRYVTDMQLRHRVDPSRTCLVGFSQGVAVAVAAIAREPVCSRAVLVCGRIPDRDELTGDTPLMITPPPVDVLVVAGGRDRFAHPDDVRADLATGFLRGSARCVLLAELGHEFTADVARLAHAHATNDGDQ